MKRAMKILLMTSAFFLFAGGMFGPIYAVFVEDIGGDLLTAGGAYAVFSLTAGSLIILISRWEDHVKHQEKLIIMGYALSCIGFLGYLFINEPIHLFIVQAIFGVGEAVSTPAYDSLYSKLLEKGKFASQWGLWDGMYYIVLSISAVVGGVLATLFGFKFIFIIMFFFSLIGLFVAFFLFKMKKLK